MFGHCSTCNEIVNFAKQIKISTKQQHWPSTHQSLYCPFFNSQCSDARKGVMMTLSTWWCMGGTLSLLARGQTWYCWQCENAHILSQGWSAHVTKSYVDVLISVWKVMFWMYTSHHSQRPNKNMGWETIWISTCVLSSRAQGLWTETHQQVHLWMAQKI